MNKRGDSGFIGNTLVDGLSSRIHLALMVEMILSLKIISLDKIQPVGNQLDFINFQA
jgi:hypothetical protein